MSYVPQNKAEIMYNLYSGRKNSIFQKKKGTPTQNRCGDF